MSPANIIDPKNGPSTEGYRHGEITGMLNDILKTKLEESNIKLPESNPAPQKSDPVYEAPRDNLVYFVA